MKPSPKRVAPVQPGLTDDQMALAIDRMGHLVLGLKHLFDMHCDDGKFELNADVASGLFVYFDFNLKLFVF